MLFAILLLFHGSFCLEQKCPSGYKFQQSGTAPGACIQCENGVNFMPEEGHSNTHCYNCSQIDNPKADIVISECNRTHDTEILCRSGYYRYKARSILEKDSCRKCNQCRNSVRACEGYHDTVCCRPEDDAVLIHSGMFVCQKRPVLCGPGQYYNMALAGCSPCSPGTYMREVNHRNEECVKCETLSGNPAHHALVVFQCNITSPTLFGCEDGFFRDILHESLLLEAKCSPCRKCIREVTSCDMYHDAVCYISHDPVSDTGDSKNRTRINESSLETTQNMTFCDEGQFLSFNTSEGTMTCKPCQYVTLEDLLTLNTTACQDCVNQTIIRQFSACSPAGKDDPETQFRFYNVILFQFALLVDVLLMQIVYGRQFLKKNSNYFPRRSSQTGQKISRLIGTFGMNVHFIFIFIHIFGTLCEVIPNMMHGATLWGFTVSVWVATLCLYLADILLFLFVKHLLSLNTCDPRFRRKAGGRADSGQDDALTFIDSTEC